MLTPANRAPPPLPVGHRRHNLNPEDRSASAATQAPDRLPTAPQRDPPATTGRTGRSGRTADRRAVRPSDGGVDQPPGEHRAVGPDGRRPGPDQRDRAVLG